MASFRKSKKEQAAEDPTRLPRSLQEGGKGLTFFGAAIPPEVAAAVPLLHALPPDALRPLLQQVLGLLRGTVRDVSDEQFLSSQRKMLGKLEALQLEQPFDGESYGTLLSGLYSLVRVAVRSKSPADTLRADLLRMHVPAAAVDALLRAVQSVRPEIEVSPSSRVHLSRIHSSRIHSNRVDSLAPPEHFLIILFTMTDVCNCESYSLSETGEPSLAS